MQIQIAHIVVHKSSQLTRQRAVRTAMMHEYSTLNILCFWAWLHTLSFPTLSLNCLHDVARSKAYPEHKVAFSRRVWQLPGVNKILQVVTDFFGRVVQDGADEAVFIIIIITGVGITEWGGPLTGHTALNRGSFGAALLILHAEHQVILHDAYSCVDKRGNRSVSGLRGQPGHIRTAWGVLAAMLVRGQNNPASWLHYFASPACVLP